MLYHFFTITDSQSQTRGTLVRNLAYQLAVYNNATRSSAKAFYTQAGEGSQPVDHEQLLRDLIKVPKRVYIIIDALDECTEQLETCKVIRMLCEQKDCDIRILTSTNTTQSLQTEETLTDLKRYKIDISPMIINNDIENHINELNLSRQWNDDKNNEIISYIMANCDGS